MSLDRCTGEEEIDLIIRIPKTTQVFDTTEDRLAISNGNVHVMLFSVFVDTEAFESQVATGSVVWLDGAWEVDWGFHSKVCYAVLHDAEVDGYDAGHFDGTAEGDFAVT